MAPIVQGSEINLLATPLVEIHRRLNAKMVPFAGYIMPIQYPTGIVAEHHYTRQCVGLFDVSHMGALEVTGEGATEALECLLPCDLKEMPLGQVRYGVLMLGTGGILDDLLITRQENGYLLVVNAGRKTEDIAHLESLLEQKAKLHIWEKPVMIALQGPKAAGVLTHFFLDISSMPFMMAAKYGNMWISRSGYTGEDGFEILAPEKEGVAFVEKLLAIPEVKPIGLGARDSLRLEAGLCLYGHELTEDITPIEAGIEWSLGKRRRQEGGFLGAEKVLLQLTEGPKYCRVGLSLLPGAIAREGAAIQTLEGKPIGQVTSGGHSPTLGYPIAMGYMETAYTKVDTEVNVEIRGQIRVAKVVKMPFVPHAYFKN